MNAWPSPRQAVFEGWLLRAAGGAIRRANSVNPLRGARATPARIIAVAEAVYGARRQTPLFRITSLVAADGLDEALAAAGYAPEGRTATLHADLSLRQEAGDSAAELSSEAGMEWLTARQRLNGVDDAEQRIYKEMLASIVVPKAFAATRADGEIAAVAYGAITNGLTVIESVVTDAALRGRGLGKRTVGALLAWGRANGAQGACLQVVADNAPAVALYRGLGFTRELSRYHYRRKTTQSEFRS